MEGISNQLEKLGDKSGHIFYLDRADEDGDLI
jgi:hypothetical protein